MATNLVDEAKSWLPYFYGVGVWDEHPSLEFYGKKVDDEVVDVMYKMLRFLVESNFLNDATKLWLKSNAGSVKLAVEEFNRRSLEVVHLNFNTVKSKIQYDKKKVHEIFGSDALYNLIIYPEKNLEDINRKLMELERKYADDKDYMRALVIKPPKDVMCREITDTEWEWLYELLGTYSIKRIEKINKGEDDVFTSRLYGYFNYLVATKGLSGVDEERLRAIRELLGLVD